MSSNDRDDLEYIYSPSKWCQRFKTSEECLDNFIRTVTTESILVRETIPGDLNVPYGNLEKEKYDLFGTNLPDSAPIIFYVHGGYWQEETIGRPNSSCIAKVFYKNGIKSFIIGYELCPKVKIEDIVAAYRKALKICLNYAKSKSSSGICLMGHSVGANLIAHLFTGFTETLPPDDLQLLKTAFLIGGVYNVESLLRTTYNIPLKLTPESARTLSPLLQGISNCDTKFFVIVGKHDSPAFVKQSEMFHNKLIKNDITSSIVVMENIDHFNILENLTEDDFELTMLILKTIKENY